MIFKSISLSLLSNIRQRYWHWGIDYWRNHTDILKASANKDINNARTLALKSQNATWNYVCYQNYYILTF